MNLKKFTALTALIMIFPMHVNAGNSDVRDSGDYPLIGRFKNSWIVNYRFSEFDQFGYIGGKSDKPGQNVQQLEGRIYHIAYLAEKGISPLQLYLNFKTKLNKVGFVTQFECEMDACGNNFSRAFPNLQHIYMDNQKGRYLAAKNSRAGKGDVYTMLYCGSLGLGGDLGKAGCQVSVVEVKNLEYSMVDAKPAPTIKTRAPGKDIDGSQDYPMIGRFKSAWIKNYQYRDFDQFPYISGKNDKPGQHTQTISGKVFYIAYLAGKNISPLQMYRNYKQKMNKSGFTTQFECEDHDCGSNFRRAYPALRNIIVNDNNIRYMAGKYSVPGKGDIYATLLCGSLGQGGDLGKPGCQISVVEEKTMENSMVDAKTINRSIKQAGSVSLYGIYFDTDQATLKPSSASTLAEIAKFLKSQPSIKLIVVGHTDNQGEFAYNIQLSRQRAEAVKTALTAQYGVSASRLRTWGAGMTSPVATNGTEQGRALNRRVALVAE